MVRWPSPADAARLIDCDLPTALHAHGSGAHAGRRRPFYIGVINWGGFFLLQHGVRRRAYPESHHVASYPGDLHKLSRLSMVRRLADKIP